MHPCKHVSRFNLLPVCSALVILNFYIITTSPYLNTNEVQKEVAKHNEKHLIKLFLLQYTIQESD